MNRHLEYQIKLLNLGMDRTIASQCENEDSPLYGAGISPLRTYYGGESGAGLAREFLLGYYAPGSKHYRDEMLLERCGRALDFASRMQKSDGTFDLLETNFHDGAQTSFIVTLLAPAVLLMRAKSEHTPKEDALYRKLLTFLDHCADGMVNGGFHTPNHRWVMASALSMCYSLLSRKDCLDKMNKLLGEGIDQDEDGEFTERSSGTYSIICDRAFIILGEVMGMKEMPGIAAKNLRMILKFVEPDLTINTMNSTRQDAGTMPDWRIYYGLYLFMALRTGDPVFRFVADAMLDQSASRLSEAGIEAGVGLAPYFEYLPFALMDENLQKDWDAADTERPVMDYTKLFTHSGILRHRRGLFSLTLVKNNPNFALLKYGRHDVFLRLCGTFYAQGQFVAEEMNFDGDTAYLTYRRRWGYKGPLPERQETSDWRKMDHSKRPDVMMQDFVFRVSVKILESGAEIHVLTEGVESVLTKFEVIAEAGQSYVTDGVFLRTKKGDYVIQSAPEAEYRCNDGATLFIRGGIRKHTHAENMRGSVPADGGRFTVAMTADTPMDSTFTLEFK